MATTSIVCFLLLVSFAGGRAQQLITPGSSLFPTTKPSWFSPASRFAFGFYRRGSDGFAVGIWLVGVDPMTVVWTAFRDDPPLTSSATLDFTKDGKLLLRTGQGRETLIANTTKLASYASMLDSGNFVLYEKDSKSAFIWQSFEHPTDTILGGQTLFPGGQLFSSLTKTDHSTGRFHLWMQLDGNLVLYPTKSGNTPADAYWNTGTSGTGFNPLNFKFDLYLNNTGLLQIINKTTSKTVWTVNDGSSQGSSINDNITYRATLDSDGNFRLYSHAYDESGHFTNISSKIWEAVNTNALRDHSNVIHLGSSLSPGTNSTSWLSPSGLFAFGFYPNRDGFDIGIWLINQTEKTIIWTAKRDDPAVSSNATLVLTSDGKLLLRTHEQGREVYIADVAKPAASAAMFDSGNFVLYNNNSDVIWESFDFPTDTILGSQSLSARNSLVSSVSQSVQSSGRFHLDMQVDGRLVAYPVNSSAESDDSYWSSETVTATSTSRRGGISKLTLDDSGLLFVGVYDLAKSSYSDKNNGIIIHRATLDVDGIFRLYSHHFEGNNSSSMLMEWSALPNQCQVKGFCGSNSYCSGMRNKADCNCYPGFDFIDSSNKFLGCYRNFDNNACRRSKDPAILYSVVPFENLLWGDYPYSVVQMKKEDCGKSCLEDCNCGAVLYSNDDCNKYKLPLRYGRKTENTSDTAFFKVIRENIIATPPPDPLAPKVVTESKRGLILILAISFGFISSLCFIFAICSFFRYRRQVFRYRRLSENANLGLTEEFTLRSFSYNELEKVTCGFKEELGRGPFGAVYKGTISGGNKAVAVKRLEKVVEEGQREFQAEMTAIARTHHRNLVRLLGFCIEGSRKLLVYEYMSNGSVADLLFKAEMRSSWRERVKIALDVARGILYLHEECEVHIIHCNIKPQNILVDETGTAKISDFGLAKLLLPNQSRATTGVEAEGTSGYSYLAPEQQKNALISVKADTYSFGIVLLEIVCCRSSIEVKAPTADEIILSSWVYQCFVTGELDKLVEDENVDFVTLERMVKVGLWCIQEDPDLRPSMKNVILMLDGAMHIPVPPSPVVSLVS